MAAVKKTYRSKHKAEAHQTLAWFLSGRLHLMPTQLFWLTRALHRLKLGTGTAGITGDGKI